MVDRSGGTAGATRTRHTAGTWATLEPRARGRRRSTGNGNARRRRVGSLITPRTLRWGQPTTEGKDVTEGRRPHRPLLPDTGGAAHQQPPFLRGRANTAPADTPQRFRELSRCREAARLRACGDALNKAAASGVDQRTAAGDAGNVQAQIAAVAPRLKAPRDRAPLVRRWDLPTGNGTGRPGGRPAHEEKRVQLACAQLLTAIYAPDFVDGRSGERPGRGAHEAVSDRPCALQYGT